MKEIKDMFRPVLQSRSFKAGLGFATALAVAGVVGSSMVPRAHASGPRGDDARWLLDVEKLVQTAELDQLLADFHGALSYGGNATAMMNLWDRNSSLVFNGTSYEGKAAVQSFFTTGGYFHNNWVSLAPEFKTQIKIHGNRAELSTQCVATDISVTPNVVKSVVQVEAVAEEHDGKWLFISMNNTSPAPL
ncbi:MAG TPA: hypothetical protein VGO67_26340 [Verrucomicrobiae bacterium]|jgi:hypothetical protein